MPLVEVPRFTVTLNGGNPHGPVGYNTPGWNNHEGRNRGDRDSGPGNSGNVGQQHELNR